jgi:hypothetical protein
LDGGIHSLGRHPWMYRGRLGHRDSRAYACNSTVGVSNLLILQEFLPFVFGHSSRYNGCKLRE